MYYRNPLICIIIYRAGTFFNQILNIEKNTIDFLLDIAIIKSLELITKVNPL
jgi:hypothetical protein